MAPAPRPTASRMNALPSAFAPCSAKKSARSCTLRESQATCRISVSAAPAGTCASVSFRRSPSFIRRFETRGGEESVWRASAWFVAVIFVSSSVWFNPVFILIPVSPPRLRFLWRRCPELHRDLGAASDAGFRSWSLIRSKTAANQHGVESQPHGEFGHIAHRLAAEIGHRDVAAFIDGHGHNLHLCGRMGGCIGLHSLRCGRQLVGLSREIHRSKIFEGLPLGPVLALVRSLHQFRAQRNVPRNIEIRQDLLGNPLEYRRSYLSALMQANRRIERHQDGYRWIADRRKPGERCNQLCRRIAPRRRIDLLCRPGFPSRGP